MESWKKPVPVRTYATYFPLKNGKVSYPEEYFITDPAGT